MRFPELIPLEDVRRNSDIFRVRHCRVTSLASGMLRMILEADTLCDGSQRVKRNRRLWGERGDAAVANNWLLATDNWFSKATLYVTLPAQSTRNPRSLGRTELLTMRRNEPVRAEQN